MTHPAGGPGRRRLRRTPVVTLLAALPLALAGCGLVGGDDASTSTGTPSTSVSTASAGAGSTTTDAPTSRATTTDATTAGGRSVGEIYSAARTSAQAARSGRVVGSLTTEGEKVAIDLSGTADGSNQKLVLTTSDGRLTVHTVAGKFYLVADKAYWSKNAGATAAEQLAGKYVLMSQEDASSFGGFTLRALLDQLFGDTELSPLEAVRTEVAPTTVGGQSVYVLADSASDTGRIVVSADAKAELRSVSVGGANPATLTFSQWNAAPTVPAPPAKAVVRL